MTQPVRHFLDLWRMDGATLRAILDDAHARKAARKGWTQGRVDPDAPARERTLAMIGIATGLLLMIALVIVIDGPYDGETAVGVEPLVPVLATLGK